jgi:hypothetical protein
MAQRNIKRYWLDDPSVSWTRSQIKKLPKKKRIGIATAWFLQNYEDPANKTPYESREGGYQYIWGGPYDAADEIGSEFGNALSDSEIEAAVEQVQEDGIYDWAPARIGEDTDMDDATEETISIGHPLEQERRKEVLKRLDDLDQAIASYTSKPPGLGHNNPPEALPIEGAISIEIHELHIHVHELKQAFAAELPDKIIVRKASGFFKKAMDKVIDLTKKALEKGIVSGLTIAGAYIGDKIGLLPVIAEKVQAAWEAIQSWLSLVTFH